jgi:glycosyltransferase involved in cell wall biosynthesis
MPRLSVIIPAHNAAPYIGEAIDSVFAQGIADLEVIVVDDGSTDGTAEAAAGRGPVRVLRQPAGGSARARNRGLAASSAPLVAFLDADDLWVPEKTRIQLEQLERDGAAMIFSDMVAFRGGWTAGRTYFQERGFDGRCALSSIFLCDMISTPTVIATRACLEAAGPFDESLPIGQDTDLWFRIARDAPFTVIDQPLVRRRFHETNVTRDRRLLARCIEEVWGRYLPLCEQREPERREALRAHFQAIRWNHLFEEGCGLRREGRTIEARRLLAEAMALRPARLRAWAFYGATFLGAPERRG